MTCSVHRKVILGRLTASVSRRPTDSPRSSGRETLPVLRRLAGLGRSRTPQTDCHQTGCGRNQSPASSGGIMADKHGSDRHAADRRSHIGVHKRSEGGGDGSNRVFHPSNGTFRVFRSVASPYRYTCGRSAASGRPQGWSADARLVPSRRGRYRAPPLADPDEQVSRILCCRQHRVPAISLSGSGEDFGRVIARGYSTGIRARTKPAIMPTQRRPRVASTADDWRSTVLFVFINSIAYRVLHLL